MCSQLKPLPPRFISHLLPTPRSQEATSLPPREYGEHQRLAQESPIRGLVGPGSPAALSRRIKGAQREVVLLGGWRAYSVPRQKALSSSGLFQKATRHPEGAMDREHRLSWLPLCLLTTAKGRSPQRPQMTFPRERGTQNSWSSWMRDTGPILSGVGLLQGRCPIHDFFFFRVNHFQRPLTIL